jgi:hypothetical protein
VNGYFSESYTPNGVAGVPTGLVWFPQEANWQALAQRRLQYGVRKFQVILDYTDDFGVNAVLAASLTGMGIKVKAEEARFEATRWEYVGEFAPL